MFYFPIDNVYRVKKRKIYVYLFYYQSQNIANNFRAHRITAAVVDSLEKFYSTRMTAKYNRWPPILEPHQDHPPFDLLFDHYTYQCLYPVSEDILIYP